MGPTTYLLGALTSLICAILLLRGFGASAKRLLLWSGVCFAGLTISNILIFVDLIVLPEVDLYLLRLVTAAAAMAILLYGLIWDSQ